MRQRGAVQVLETSVGLLRAQPPTTLALYLLGSVPFHAGLLYFAADMARNPFAPERLPFESLLVAILFVWKSVWQANFAARMYAHLSLSELPEVPWVRLIATQAALQPLSLILLPVALLIALPFPASFAFFRAVGLFAAQGETRPAALASQQARLWTRQNSVLIIFASLAGMIVFANTLIAIAILPQIGRSFLGIEGDFARLGIGILNFSTLAVALTVAWMIVDPLLEAVYVIRCFHGKSVTTGQDLIVALRRAVIAAMLFVALSVGFPATPAFAQTPAPPQQHSTIDAQRLDDSIHEVIRQREFAWRAPRVEGPESDAHWVSWFRSALDGLKRAANWVSTRFREWFGSDQEGSESKPGSPGIPPLEIWMGIATLALIGGIAALFFSRRNSAVAAPSPTPTAVPLNLADETVTADQLPESSWLGLAQDLLSQGDYRLALRALYLAGLKHLGELQLVSIRRWKTGRDYRTELERRARSRNSNAAPLMAQTFQQCVRRFEDGWYGRHPVQQTDVEALAAGLEEMRRHARSA